MFPTLKFTFHEFNCTDLLQKKVKGKKKNHFVKTSLLLIKLKQLVFLYLLYYFNVKKYLIVMPVDVSVKFCFMFLLYKFFF